MPKLTITTDVWTTRVDGPNEERSILAGDWRDADRIQPLKGLTLYSNDLAFQESHSKAEPDWSLGCEARDDRNQVVMAFPGEPPQFIKECLLAGVLLYGVIVGRDQQRHGR